MSRSQRLILTIAILASFVAFLDGTLINVALPAIETELGGGLTTQQCGLEDLYGVRADPRAVTEYGAGRTTHADRSI